ncbi:MAG: flagellin [Alphaproteobacteria bacterium]|nr:flagellin [Alphaproteobacteria bacterium]
MSSSILTNYGSMAALQSLEATQNMLTNTENQISSGLKVASAKDDASSWTIATTMKSNIASLNQVSTDLGNANSILNTAVAGAGQITSLVSQIRAKVASFTDTSQNQTAIQGEVTQLVNQIGATIQSSSFNGVNLLDSSQPSGLTFVASTNNDYSGGGASPTISTGAATDLSSTSANAAAAAFYTLAGGLSAAITNANPATQQTNLDTALKQIDAFNSTVEGQAAAFGAVQQNVQSQQTFVNNLTTTLSTGVSNMVDADMTQESAKLSALQTQQQLGTQALSIANQAPQMLLKLFG